MKSARNIELKAHLRDLPRARETARRLATEYLGVQEQIDTYFHFPQGRMKLREISDFGRQETGEPRRSAQLIWYDRPDEFDAKGSDYQLTEIPDPARVQQLKAEMGIHAVVSKRREVFLCENVRIHLDDVADLGSFIEFEAVLADETEDAAGQAQVARLQREFGIAASDLLSSSYCDMLLGKVGMSGGKQ